MWNFPLYNFKFVCVLPLASCWICPWKHTQQVKYALSRGSGGMPSLENVANLASEIEFGNDIDRMSLLNFVSHFISSM